MLGARRSHVTRSSVTPSHRVTLSLYFVSGLQPASISTVSSMSRLSDPLVDPDQPNRLADHCSLEHLIGQNHLLFVPRACRHSDFVAFDAFEYDPNPIGFREDFARFHGGPWARNLPVDVDCEGLSTPLHRHTASIDAPYLSDHTLPLPSLGGQRDVIASPEDRGR